MWIVLPHFTFRLNRGSCLDHHRLWLLVQVASNLFRVDRLHIAVLAQSTAGCVQESGEVCWFVLRKKTGMVNSFIFAQCSKPDNSSNPCRHRENRDHQDDTCIVMMILNIYCSRFLIDPFFVHATCRSRQSSAWCCTPSHSLCCSTFEQPSPTSQLLSENEYFQILRRYHQNQAIKLIELLNYCTTQSSWLF